MAGDEEWRKNADTHKMCPEEVKAAGVEGSKRPPGNNPGGFLHQRRKLPYSPTTMAIAGFLIAGAATVGYYSFYTKKKWEALAGDVATGAAKQEDTRNRN